MVERSASAWLAQGARALGLALLTLLILTSGGWESWKTAHYVMLTKGRERGTVTLVHCGDSDCTGPFAPKGTGAGAARTKVTVSLPVRHHVGDKVPVVMKPGTDVGIRSGFGGMLFSWVPLGGALLLAAVVVGGGLRLGRVAWSLAAAGAAVLLGAFLTL
jgi:hypothetical protein